MKKFLIIFCIVIVSVTLYMIFDWYMRTVFSTIAMEESTKILSDCLDDALSETITGGISYEDLVTIRQDEFGNIILVQSNTIKMNIIASDAVKAAEEKLKTKGANGIQIPFGYLVGGQLFSESLPNVTVHFRQVGNVTSSFSSSFTSAGINQTIHTVNLTLNVDALLLIPNNNMNINTNITVPVCETIIIGNVPTEYWNYNNGNGYN